ncbi:MAG: hypothetical protein KAS32_03700 [Candidatus Peribacteraceae bacterium]|nr:hypothetical protein [Candidatus Peribacteraceae bacterium]
MRQTSKIELNTTSNSGQYNKMIKRYREHVGDIRCAYCPYNKGENQRHWYGAERSWKQHRMTQYKVVGV